METRKISIYDLKPAEYNPRIMPSEEMDKLTTSLRTFGLVDPIIIDLTDNNTIIGGHQRYEALMHLDEEELTLIPLGDIGLVINETNIRIKDKNDQKAMNLALNKIQGGWDWDKLDEVFNDLINDGYQIELTGFDEDELKIDLDLELNELNSENTPSPLGELFSEYKDDPSDKGALLKKYIIPPFSVLDSQSGNWQNRKNHWKQLINNNGESRENILNKQGTSIFDPVLAEILITWFTLPNKTNNIIDVFAGGSELGSVSSALGHIFKGIELRKEQCELNNKRIKKFSNESYYICDDGQNVLNHIKPETQDLLISCPPYYDLEVYSDLENDASNQETYADFINILKNAYTNALKTLKEDRFAIIICGDIRNKKGGYYGFPQDIIQMFKENKLYLYNYLILKQVPGTARIRANNYFKNRKIVKIHQDVLIFYKGNPKNIKEIYGELNDTLENNNSKINKNIK